MENYWTSNKPIYGLRHFVLVNETKEKGIDEIFINEDSLFNIS